VVWSRLERDGEIGTEERGTDFCNQFLARIGVVAKALAKIAVATMRWRRPVDLMPISA